MGLIVLFNSLTESFDDLVWTLITLVYPLYVSIRAIEGNSNAHNRKFLIYWIIYALIMLFEVTSAKLIEWIPLWSYIKLIIACWLVLPRFEGAVHAYEYIVRPCISVEPQKLVDWFKILREEFLLHQKDDFLLLAQRYIKENGSQALENLIIEKSICNCMGTNCRTESNAVETIEEAHEAVAATPDEELTSVVPIPSSGVAKNMKVKHTEPVLTQTDHKTIQATTDKRVIELTAAAVGAGNESILGHVESTHEDSKEEQTAVGAGKDSILGHVESTHGDSKEEQTAVGAGKDSILGHVESTHDDSKEEQTAVGAGKDSILGHVEPTHDNSKKGQKEWTCAICQVSTTNEAGLKDHLKGKKHKAKKEELRAINTANKRRNNIASSIKSDQKPNQPPQMEQKNKANVPILPNPKYIKKQQVGYKMTTTGADQGPKNMQTNPVLGHDENAKLRCDTCNLQCNSKSMLRSHLYGKKHLERCKIN